MRPLVDRARLDAVLRELGRHAEAPTRLFLVGGSSASLSKIQRGFETDRADVRSMMAEGLVDPKILRGHFASVVEECFRFPAVNVEALSADLDRLIEAREKGEE